MSWSTLYASGWFHTINVSGKEAHQRVEASKEAVALDRDIEAAREKLRELSAYADAAQAAHEEEMAKEAMTLYRQEVAAREASIASAL